MEQEWKIGEIFELKGEWYQCLKSSSCRCDYCDFGELGDCDITACTGSERKDGKEVHFKKLKKVGEPFVYEKRAYQTYELYTPTDLKIQPNEVRAISIDGGHYTVDIEVKQNKEDMEECKMYDAKEDIPEFDKVVDECLFGENKPNLKPFDLEAAKSGKPVCTRDGRKVRIICFDREFIYKGQNYCIVALVNDGPYSESLYSYTEDGLFNPNKIHNYDLMMLPEKKEGWAVIRRSDIYETEEQAKEVLLNSRVGVMIRKINWEE